MLKNLRTPGASLSDLMTSVIAEVKAKAREIRGVKIIKQSKYLRHFTAEMAWV